MDKVKGVPLSQVWTKMQLPQKLQVLLAVTRMQKRWLGVSLSHYGSLYYASDLQTPAGSHYAKDGKVIMDSGFALGPATVGGDFIDTGTIKSPYLWHDDLHDDNIFVDPSNPEEITGIIDWQSCHISPLYNHNPDPAFLSWDGLEPETLDLLPRPKLSGLSPEERAAALHEYSYHNIFIGWKKLMQAKNPGLYEAVEFRKTASYGLIFLAHRMLEYGETHFESLLADLKDTWPDLPARIKISSDHAVASTDLVTEVKEQLDDLWPDKGFIEHDRFDECKSALEEVRLQILEQMAKSEEERAEFDRYWPFK
ncbi:hypothetical protein TESG_06980 [Trichophyton tonsurans CBS 112818]|uniref:Altered inheritance of mitochondria protein 9, mitochondrial n=1 Tax=Trichophyton tonsurans (strain CBS 112818) TaxID=647933 RepID=F2S7T6_TRIT1|nr:hypothetical protein TESG_06980 [Trichophyton tonsurans CBS 112818]